MKANSWNLTPLSISLCAAAVFVGSELDAQDVVSLRSNITTLRLAAGDTNAIAERVAALQPRLARAPRNLAANAVRTNIVAGNADGSVAVDAAQLRVLTLAAKPQAGMDSSSGGGALESLTLNNRILNVDLNPGNKTGFAAVGQTANDYWNPLSAGTLQNLLWSDQTTSPADASVTSAGQWGNSLCLDPMYLSFLYSDSLTATLTELPADTYDFYVYATRASDNGAPVIELKRGGVSLQTKGTSLWGNGWYSQFWDEGEQYVRFRNVAVNNQTITLDSYPDAAGYATISGLQIVPSSAIPSEQPAITKLLNVNLGNGSGAKTGFAAVSLASNDYWNGYQHPGEYAATVANLKWSDQTDSAADLTVRNAPGAWGIPGLDPMLFSFIYGWDGGDITITLTDIPAGNCNVNLYTPQTDAGHNSIYELWSDDVNQGIKGTTLWGYDYLNAPWEPHA